MGIFMGRTVPSADPSTVWLADLIEAAEVLGASAELCDPAIVRAFSHRLEMPGLAPTAVRSALHRLVAQVTMNHPAAPLRFAFSMPSPQGTAGVSQDSCRSAKEEVI